MDIKKYLLGSLIILLVAVNSFLIVTTVYGNSEISQKFNFEKLDEYIGVIANKNKVSFEYDINQEFIQSGLSFNVNEKLLNKEKIKVEMKFDIGELEENSELDFVMGFTSFDEMIHQRGYFNIKIVDKKIVFDSFGEKLKSNIKTNSDEIKVTYIIDKNKNKIEMIIASVDQTLELSSKLDEEFSDGFKLDDFMFSVNKLRNLKFTISELKLVY